MRRTVEAVTGSSSGGVTVTEWRGPLGRKRLDIVFLGETGRERYSYLWASKSSYVVHAVEETYAAPLSAGAPDVGRRLESFLYVCAGRLLSDSAAARLRNAEDARVEADSILHD